MPRTVRSTLTQFFLLTLLSACSCDEEPPGPNPDDLACTPTPCAMGMEFRQGECRAARCSDDSECCPGQKCQTATGQCYALSTRCTDDSACNAELGQKCIEHRGERTCAYPNLNANLTAQGTQSCNASTDCSRDRNCFNHRCIIAAPCGGGCASDEVCDIDSDTCFSAPTCITSCAEGSLAVLKQPDYMSGPNCCALQCECLTLPPIAFGNYGWYADIAAHQENLYISAYDPDFGDLVFLKYNTEAELISREYVDGFPDTGELRGDPNGPRLGFLEPGTHVGQHTSIAVAADGTVHIAYHDVDNSALRYAHNAQGSWQHFIVDDTGNTGLYTSIAFDANRYPAIAYMMAEGPVTTSTSLHSALKLARTQTNAPASANDFVIEVLDQRPTPDTDPDGDFIAGVGLFADLLFDREGKALIGYYDHLSGELRLAVETENGWLLRTLDGGVDHENRDVGAHLSLASGKNGELGIAYMDQSEDQLLYFDISTETREVVDDGLREYGISLVGADASLLFDAQGRPAIAYQDPSSLDLRYARRFTPGEAWQISTLVGQDASLQSPAGGFYAAQARVGDQAFVTHVDINFDAEQRLQLGFELIKTPLAE